MRKAGGHDAGKLYAMKVLRKAALVQRAKTQEHTRTERSLLELVRQAPFLVTLHYAFQTDAKLHLILGKGRPCGVGGATHGGCFPTSTPTSPRLCERWRNVHPPLPAPVLQGGRGARVWGRDRAGPGAPA